MSYNKSIGGKLFKYFQDRLNIKESTKGWYKCNCPFCGVHYGFAMNFQSFKSKCFRCDEQNGLITLLMFLENFKTKPEAYKFLKIQQEYEYYDRVTGTKPKEVKTNIELPEGYKLITQGDNIIAKCARNYMKKRGFNINKLASVGVGYCDEGEYDGYIIFPYYKKGELIYYQGRIFMGSGIKIKNPELEESGLGKTQIIYNEDSLFIYNTAYVLESITNCLTLGDRTVGLSGKSISTYQLSRLIKSPCERFILILDPDALDKSLNLAMQLVHHKKVKVIQLPGNEDVNSYGKQKTLELVKEADYLKYMQLYKMKLNYERPITSY